MLIEYSDLVALLEEESEEKLGAAIDKAVAKLGFSAWVYGLVVPETATRARNFVLHDYPEEWMEHYLVTGLQEQDPITLHAQSRVTPLIWNESLASDEVGKAFFGQAREFGLRGGIGIPVRGLGCHWGIVSFASAEDRSERELQSIAAETNLLGTFLHQAGHRLAQSKAQAGAHLTERELEVLRWASDGKTSWEIGKIMGISERTAVFHLRNVTKKLGVNNRQQAIAQAIAWGLLEPATARPLAIM